MSAGIQGRRPFATVIPLLILAVVIILALGAITAYSIGGFGSLEGILGQLAFESILVAFSILIAVRASRRAEWGPVTRRAIIWCVGVGSVIAGLGALIANAAAGYGTSLGSAVGIGAGAASVLATIAWLVGIFVWGRAEGRSFFSKPRP